MNNNNNKVFMKQEIFKCPLTNYYIEYIIDAQYALMNTVVTDYVYLNAFFSLLRLSIDSLQKKGILYIRQFVSNDEYESFLKNKTTWHIKNREEETLELICKT